MILRIAASVIARSPGRQAVQVELLGNDIFLGDMRFLFLAVAGKLQDFEAVEEWRGDRFQHVGRGDEHHFRQVEIDVEIMVAKCRVLLGIEHFQERRRGVAAEVGPELVDLVEHEDGVIGAGLANSLDHPARQGRDIGAAMAADLGLVVHAPQADPHELAAQGLGDALAQRSLAGARRARQAEDRAFHVFFQLAHGQVFEDPLLDLLEIVMVGVEDLAGPPQVEPVAAGLAPGENRQPVEIGPDDRVLGRARVHSGQPLELAFRLGLHLARGVGVLDPFPQLADLGVFVLAFAQLVLDRLHLLAEEMVALGLGELAADLLLDLGRKLEDRELPRQVLPQSLEPCPDVDLAQQDSVSPRS